MEYFLNTIGAINDETRVKLLWYFNKYGTKCVCEVQNDFEMIQSRLSRHLKILKDGGFLRVQRDGKWAYYSIKSPIDSFRESIIKEISYLDIDINSKGSCKK